MTWENPRTPAEKQQVRIETARKRLEGVMALMADDQRYLIFTGRSSGPKSLWRTFTKAELAEFYTNNDKLMGSVGLYGTFDLTLVPANGVIEAYL